MGILHGIKETLRALRRSRNDDREPDVVERDFRVPWRRELQSVLRGRGRPDLLPDELDLALEKAGGELQAAGRDLVRTSVQALLEQIEAVKASGATGVLEERRRRLAQRLDDLDAEWSSKLKTALGSMEDGHQGASDAVGDGATGAAVRPRSSGRERPSVVGDRVDPGVLHREVRERLDNDLARLRLPRDVSLPAGFAMWSAFAHIEVAIGALVAISELRTEAEDRSQPAETQESAG